MKRILLLMMFMCSLCTWAQDVIVKKDGSTVVCRVIEVTKTEVIYKKWTDLEGSNYIIDKSLVSAINYENGKKDNLDDTAATVQSTKLMTDDELLKMVSNEEVQKKIKTPAQLKAKITRLKRVGWIGGGVCMAAGVALIVTGCLIEDEWYHWGWTDYISGQYHSESYFVNETLWNLTGPGIALLAGGAALTTGCLVKAHKTKKQILQSQYSVHSTPLYHQEFKLKNGASFATGIDFLGDNTNRHPALGIGLNYKF